MLNSRVLGQRIKELRKQNNLTLKQLASQSHISISYLSDIERGRCNPSLETLHNIAHALKTSPSYFLESGPKTPVVAETSGSVEPVKIPLLKSILYDQALFDEENVQEYIWISLQQPANQKELFFFRVGDNLMINFRLLKGDLVLVRINATVNSGDLVLAVFKETGACIRKAYRLNNRYILDANHPEIKPVLITKNSPARIVGKVILALINID